MARETVLLTAADMRRALTRMAHEIVERNHGTEGLVLAGLLTRGVPLAHRIARTIADFEGVEPPVASLDIGLYRDDLARRAQQVVRPTAFPVAVDDTRVVLVVVRNMAGGGAGSGRAHFGLPSSFRGHTIRQSGQTLKCGSDSPHSGSGEPSSGHLSSSRTRAMKPPTRSR